MRAILTVLLLLGGGVGDWAALGGPAPAPHESCCCGTPADLPDSCPCPKPEGNRSPSRTPCPDRQAVVSLQASRQAEAQRRQGEEARPVAVGRSRDREARVLAPGHSREAGRDVDLGRHLARLSLLRI